jgi:hypothetical protein
MDERYGVRIKQDNGAVLQTLVTEISTLREEISQLKKDFSILKQEEPCETHDSLKTFVEEESTVFPLDLITEVTDENAVSEEPVVTDSTVVPAQENSDAGISPLLLDNIKSVLLYVDKLLEALPEAKITEFANSDYFRTYRNVFNELGLT